MSACAVSSVALFPFPPVYTHLPSRGIGKYGKGFLRLQFHQYGWYWHTLVCTQLRLMFMHSCLTLGIELKVCSNCISEVWTSNWPFVRSWDEHKTMFMITAAALCYKCTPVVAKPLLGDLPPWRFSLQPELRPPSHPDIASRSFGSTKREVLVGETLKEPLKNSLGFNWACSSPFLPVNELPGLWRVCTRTRIHI